MARNGNTKREAVALRLAGGASVRGAARACHVGERTVHTWLADPAFTARVLELRSQMFARAVGVLTRLAGKAAQKLNRLIDSEHEGIALGACRTVLEAGPRLRESAELVQRIEALEAQQRLQAERGHQGTNGRAMR